MNFRVVRKAHDKSKDYSSWLPGAPILVERRNQFHSVLQGKRERSGERFLSSAFETWYIRIDDSLFTYPVIGDFLVSPSRIELRTTRPAVIPGRKLNGGRCCATGDVLCLKKSNVVR